MNRTKVPTPPPSETSHGAVLDTGKCMVVMFASNLVELVSGGSGAYDAGEFTSTRVAIEAICNWCSYMLSTSILEVYTLYAHVSGNSKYVVCVGQEASST